MTMTGTQSRHCHSERAERVEESKVWTPASRGSPPQPRGWIPAYAGMTVRVSDFIFIPLRGLGKDMGNSDVGGNEGGAEATPRRV